MPMEIPPENIKEEKHDDSSDDNEAVPMSVGEGEDEFHFSENFRKKDQTCWLHLSVRL